MSSKAQRPTQITIPILSKETTIKSKNLTKEREEEEVLESDRQSEVFYKKHRELIDSSKPVSLNLNSFIKYPTFTNFSLINSKKKNFSVILSKFFSFSFKLLLDIL